MNSDEIERKILKKKNKRIIINDNCFLCNKFQKGIYKCTICEKGFCNKCLKSNNIKNDNLKNNTEIKYICPKCNLKRNVLNYEKELKKQKIIRIICKKCHCEKKIYIFKTMNDIFLFIKSINQYKPEYKEMELVLSNFKIKGEPRIFCKNCLKENLNEENSGGIYKFFNHLDLIKFDFKNIDIEDDENDTLSSTIKFNENNSIYNNNNIIQSNNWNKVLFKDKKINNLFRNKIEDINEQIVEMRYNNLFLNLTYKKLGYYLNILDLELKNQLLNTQQLEIQILNKFHQISETKNKNNH